MVDSINSRYGTSTSDSPTQLAEASIKQESLDEDISHGDSKGHRTATLQEASSSNCSSKRDPLADDIEFGETGISFQNAFFNVVGNEIKSENIIADKIQDNGDIIGTKKRKICDEDSDDDSSATRSTRQSANLVETPSISAKLTGRTSQPKKRKQDVRSEQISECMEAIKRLTNHATASQSSQARTLANLVAGRVAPFEQSNPAFCARLIQVVTNVLNEEITKFYASGIGDQDNL